MRKLSASTYECILHEEWCIGSGKSHSSLAIATEAQVYQYQTEAT